MALGGMGWFGGTAAHSSAARNGEEKKWRGTSRGRG